MALFRCPQRWLSTDELEELRRVEYELIEEGYPQSVESRGIDPGQDLLQIFAGPFESNFGEDWGRQGVSPEADAGFPGQGEVVGFENEGEVTRGCSTQRGR